VRVRLSPPLSCKITLAPVASPEIVPPIVAVTGLVVHATATVVTLAVAVPLLADAVHVCAVGCVFTSTSYAPATAVLNVNGTEAPPVPGVMVRVSVALSDKTKPVPVKPLTLPPLVYVPVVPPVPPLVDVFFRPLQALISSTAPARAKIDDLLGIMFVLFLYPAKDCTRARPSVMAGGPFFPFPHSCPNSRDVLHYFVTDLGNDCWRESTQMVLGVLHLHAKLAAQFCCGQYRDAIAVLY